MPNEMKYGNVDWPSNSPISGERLSTSGEYTGQHKGTVIQDSLSDADNGAYLRARETIRYGTLTPDAGDGNLPRQTYYCRIYRNGSGHGNLLIRSDLQC